MIGILINVAQLKFFISEDQLEKVIKALISSPEQLELTSYNEVIILSRDLHGILRASRNGAMEWQALEAERRRISIRLLELLDYTFPSPPQQIGNDP